MKGGSGVGEPYHCSCWSERETTSTYWKDCEQRLNKNKHVRKQTPSNAGDLRLIPGWEAKLPHAMVSPCATTSEKPASHSEKIQNAATKTRSSQINK